MLGLALSLAPLGAWIAVSGRLDVPALYLGLAVLFWVAGFDVLYALQDIEFDRSFGLYSIPRYLGIRGSLYLSRIFHVLTLLFLLMAGEGCSLGWVYRGGLAVVTLLFVYEHSLVRADDLSKLDVAFFNMNGYISVSVFLFTFLDMLF